MSDLSPRIVDCSSIDTVRIAVLGEGRYHSIPAKVILHAFEYQSQPGTLEYLARSVIQFAETIAELQALQGDPERCIRKIRGHVGGLVVDAKLALGMKPFGEE